MAGVPHRKLTMLGYNAVNGRYEFVTADNLDTQQMVYQGSSDERTGVITMIAIYTQAVYAEMIASDGLSRAAGGPSRIARSVASKSSSGRPFDRISRSPQAQMLRKCFPSRCRDRSTWSGVLVRSCFVRDGTVRYAVW